MTTLVLVLIIVVLLAYIRKLEIGGFGALSKSALLVRLWFFYLLRIPLAIVCLDIRGMHSLNAALGYSIANQMVGRLIKSKDTYGQYGGDEIVVVVPMPKPGAARKIMYRISDKAKQFTADMSPEKRQELIARTAGKIDGVHIAAIATERTLNPFYTIKEAMDKLEEMKEHGCTITGNRETTGNRGTLLAEL